MITAKNAREKVNQIIQKEIANERKLAIEFCEELSKHIEELANEKVCNAFVEVPSGKANITYVVSELRNNGYQTKILGCGKLEIMW